MKPVSLRLITDNAKRLVNFYQEVTGLPPTWYTDDFAEFVTPTFTLAIGSTSTMDIFGAGAGHTTDNRTPILEFLVDDVDQEYEKLKKITSDFVLEPTTQPWGNRSVMFRDPDGHLLNFFTPVSEQAIKKFNS